MSVYRVFGLSLVVFSFGVYADDARYCPTHHNYIKVGMTEEQVIAACGQPMSKRASGRTVTQQIPVTQLVYSTLNQGSLFAGWSYQYSMWSLPSGSNGTSVSVDVIDGKIASMRLNGNGTNALTVCGGKNVEVGEPVSAVYAACGAPSLINNTYINRPVPAAAKPEVWTYQFDGYQPAVNLTFVNGTLQSIE